jgi:signal transduction histidine kinase/CheY-like chemotaxis protein
VVEKIQHCWDTGHPWEDTFPLRGKDGNYRWFLSRANPIYNDQGKIIRWFGTNTDITEYLELERALLDADQRKDQFLATLGHELRNPLAGILGGIEILEAAQTTDEERGEAQRIIMRQSRFMERLVDDLLDVSRIVRGKITLKRQTLELVQLVKEVVSDLNREFAVANISLQSDLPEGPIYCHADRERLRQVFTNLLHNARKFTPPHGDVCVRLARIGDGSAVEFVVSDTGIGMAQSTLKSMFSPFVQADDSLERSKGGLGLGLAIVRGLIELHRGTVSASSAGLNQGSSFLITLPTTSGVEKPKATSSKVGALVQPRPLNVLVVDDRRDAAFALVKFLERAGHTVHTAQDGPSGVEAAIEHQPDVIVCDIGLPGFDGYEVARRLRTEPALADKLFIAVTGYGQPQDKTEAEAAGFDCHLVKPVDRTHLLEAIASWASASC